MVAIRIDNEYLDLQEEYIAVDFLINDIGEIQSKQGEFSNDFDVPKTAHNIRVLGYSTETNVIGTYSPSRAISADLIQNNTVISSGFVQVNSKEGDKINITFYGSNIDVFELLKDKSLQEIGLSDYSHNYTGANVVSSFNNTEGYIYSVIDYGHFQDRRSNKIVSGEIFPCIYLHTLIKEMFKNIGYKVSGSILSRALYYKIVLPFVNETFGYSKDYVNSKSVYADNLLSELFAVSAGATAICRFARTIDNFNGVTYGGSSLMDLPNERYTADGDYGVTIEYRTLVSTVPAKTLILRINGVDVAESNSNYLTYTTNLSSGDYIEMYFKNDSAGVLNVRNIIKIRALQTFVETSEVNPSVCLPNITQADLLKWLLFRFAGVFSVDKFSKTVYLNQFSDLKKNLTNSDNWSDKIDLSNDIETNYIDLVSNYGQKNYANYAIDENDKLFFSYNAENDLSYGSGMFDLDNDFLEGEKIIYEAPFSPTEQCLFFNGFNFRLNYIPRNIGSSFFGEFTNSQSQNYGGLLSISVQLSPNPTVGQIIEIYEGSYIGVWTIVEVISPSRFVLNASWSGASTGSFIAFDNTYNAAIPRVLINYGNVDVATLSEITELEIMGQTVTEIPFMYFYKSKEGTELDNYGESLAFGVPSVFAPYDKAAFDSDYLDVIKMLKESQVVKAYMKLNQVDLANLDFLKPKYIESLGGYFYLNKIEGYDASGDSVLCELVKLV